jgi:CHAT domain-containing protein
LSLSVASGPDGLDVEARFLEAPTSHDLVMALMLGDYRNPDGRGTSFFAAIDAEEEPELIAIALDYSLAAMGPVARAVAGHLVELGADGATLIVCGPLSQAPLHAAHWREGDHETCLLDRFELRSAPSAALQGECIRGSRERGVGDGGLVAVADPHQGDPRLGLPAATGEVEEVARHFPQARVAAGANATGRFLRQEAPTANVLHLACHGKSGHVGAEDAYLLLADGKVTGNDLIECGIRARLSVVSACETAVANIGDLMHEAFSVGTALLVSGSAGAVATQWSIDDPATALLMTRFYEGMLEEDLPPPRALRRAQLWLRDLDEGAERAYLSTRPALERAVRDAGLRATPRRPVASGKGEPRHYSHPVFWAPFVMLGA